MTDFDRQNVLSLKPDTPADRGGDAWKADPYLSSEAEIGATGAFGQPAPALPAAAAPALPNVHAVVFRDPRAAAAADIDPLHRLLRSMQPPAAPAPPAAADAPAEPVAPAQPVAPAAPVPAAAPSLDFAQLLRSMDAKTPQAPQSTSPKLPPSSDQPVTRTRPIVLSMTPPPVASISDDELSHLLETIHTPATPAPVPASVPAVVPEAAGTREPVRSVAAARWAETTPETEAPPAAPARAAESFTQMFAAVGLDAPPAQEAVAAHDDAAPTQVIVPVAQAGGHALDTQRAESFTQLFETMDSPGKTASAEVPAAPSAHSAAPAESFTQMFATVQPSQPAVRSAEVPPAEPGVAEAALKSLEAPSPGHPSPAAAPQAAESFTQLFGTVAPASSMAESARPQTGASPAPPPAEAPAHRYTAARLPRSLTPRSDEMPPTVGFTEILRSLDLKPAGVRADAAAAKPVAAHPATDAASAAEPPSSGGLTQILRAIDAQTLGASAVQVPDAPDLPSTVLTPIDLGPRTPPPPFLPEPASAAAAAPAAQPATGGASLTAMFDAFPASGSASVPPVVPTPAAERSAAPAPPPPSSAGSFTQLFQASDLPKPGTPAGSFSPGSAASPRPQPGGSFTQLFSAADLKPQGEASQADAFPPLPAAAQKSTYGSDFAGAQSPFGSDAGFSGGGSSSPVFGSAPDPQPFGAPAATPFGAPFASPAPPSGGMSGGLTQMLRTLDGPGTPFASSSPAPLSPVQPYASAAPAGGQHDAFAQAFGSTPLAPMQPATAPPAFYPPPGTAAPPAGATFAFAVPQQISNSVPRPAAPAGPGEFTRILEANSIREQAILNQAPGGMAAPAAGGTAGQAPAAAPMVAPPGVQMPSWQMPPAPTLGSMFQPGAPPQAPTPPSFQLPGYQMPAFQMPAAPAAPAPAAPAKPAGGIMRFLPVAMIIIVVVLIVFVSAMFFMTRGLPTTIDPPQTTPQKAAPAPGTNQ